MRKWTAVLAAGLLGTAQAADDPFPNSLYAVHIWGVPFGQGVAFVIGPVRGETCSSATLPWLKSVESEMTTIPPDWQLQMSVCLRKDQLAGALNQPWFCVFQSSQAIPKAKISRLWIYSCVWRE